MTSKAPGDTIFALSSGAPPAAIAIIRISGPQADAALQQIAGRLPPSRVATLRALRDEVGGMIDRALVLRFPGPDSATGEDLVELHAHGGRATIAALSRRLGALPDLRPAEPGEFTRRAFANGRMDLAQAEGLADLLSAETEAQRRNAMRLVEGGLSAMVDRWRTALLGLAAQVEAEIEFAEEEDVVPADLGPTIANLRNAIDTALAAPPAERLRDGVRIVIAGPPNAGKSSLINALSGRPVAITNAAAGTTRDLVEAPVTLSGLPCILIDSAGLRDADEEVERIGIERSRDAIAAADILLWLGSPTDAPVANQVIRVASRCDIAAPAAGHDIAVSAVTGAGLADLSGRIAATAQSMLPREDQIAVGNRQRHALSMVSAALTEAEMLADPVLRAASLAVARAALDRVTGRAGVEEMLDTLFGKFCIGK